MTRPQDVAILILAGGRAQRMGGGDKPLLSLAGHPVLCYQLTRLHAFDCPVAINAHGLSARFADFALPVLPDDGFDHPGPLAGVLAGLLWAEGAGFRHLLTVPGDCPFLPCDLIARLWDAKDGGRMAVCATSGGQVHFTTALWPVTARSLIADALAAGERRVGRVLGMIGYQKVEWPVEPYDGFFNINTPDDLREAERMIQKHPALALLRD